MSDFLKPDAVRAFLDKVPDSRIFTVDFVKEDGEVRHMACRRGVTKHLKGGKSTIAANPDLVGVYEMNNSYRCFDVNRVISLKSGDLEVK